jgi:hypothetical protein
MAIVPDEAEEAFYLPTVDAKVFVATRHTEGPWSPNAQHAGPPSALLTRAIERLAPSTDGPCQLTRLTVDILGPVPLGEVHVSAAVTRPGRTVELVEAELDAGGRAAMRVRAWRIRTAELLLPAGMDEHLPATPPFPEAESDFRERTWTRGYLGAVQWRFTQGHFEQPGPATVWTLLRVALVAGEKPTPTQRLVTVADSGNGLSSRLPFSDWWFINTDLSIHLHRLPVGEWICVGARSTLDPAGVGLAETELFDRSGRVGRGAQSLMVGPR